MLKQLLYSTIALVISSQFLYSESLSNKRPNIVYFYLDDLGWGSLIPNGQNDRRQSGKATPKIPNIDNLTMNGVNFSRAYGAPVCSPARSCQQTGYHQGHTYADRNDRDNARKAIRKEDVTMGTLMKKAGYVTGYWGKWGYGGSSTKEANPVILNQQTLPSEHGYDYILAELHHVRAHTFFQPTLWEFKPGYKNMKLTPNSLSKYKGSSKYPEKPAYQNDKNYPKIAYADDSYAFAMLDFVREKSQAYKKTGQPFFALFAPQVPHSPFDEITQLPNYDIEFKGDKYYQKLHPQAKQWACMMSRIDSHIGNIIQALKDPNSDGDQSDSIFDNTLIVLMSDNGAASNKAIPQLGANSNLRGAKNSIFEGGIRVPCIVHWPSKINQESSLKSGTSTDFITCATDMLPTFCEIVGIDSPTGIDGVSIAPYLTGQGEQRHREYFIHESQPSRSIIRDNMKLIQKGQKYWLYDLSKNEKQDLSKAQPELRKELAQILKDEQVEAPQWTANTYHQWLGANGAPISKANNWSRYVYKDMERTYEEEEGSPRIPWTAFIHNSSNRAKAVEVDQNVDFLSLELKGRVYLNIHDKTLTARNELRAYKNVKISLKGGSISTMRWLDLRKDSTFIGYGSITGSFYHSGNLFVKDEALIVEKDFVAQKQARFMFTEESQLIVKGQAKITGELMLNIPQKLPKGKTLTIIHSSKLTGQFKNTKLKSMSGQDFKLSYSKKSVKAIAQ